jgi:hypothetical protein
MNEDKGNTQAQESRMGGIGAAMQNTQALAKASPEAFLMFDRADDEAILARMRGAALKEMVYSFPQGRDSIYGLSVEGADECKRELAKLGEVIREEDARIESETADEARFVARATRYAVFFDGRPEIKLDTALEFKRQEKYITFRNGQQGPDDSWYEKGGSKAMRNAVLKLVPQTIKQRVIEMYKAQAKNVAPSPEQVDADVAKYHATMDAKDERDALVTELKELWRYLAWTKAQVKACLRARDLSESLVDAHVSWGTVDLATITDLRDAMKKEAGR